jgi:hypothetical protein
MRGFNKADKEKKRERIGIKDNPANLPEEKLAELETAVKASLKEGYLSCPTAWKIAKKSGVPKAAVGAVTDKLGVRITDCQLGCFKVDKTPYDASSQKEADIEIVSQLDALNEKNELTCSAMFDLASEFKKKPMEISEAANIRGLKVRDCQLGCF